MTLRGKPARLGAQVRVMNKALVKERRTPTNRAGVAVRRLIDRLHDAPYPTALPPMQASPTQGAPGRSPQARQRSPAIVTARSTSNGPSHVDHGP
jgi:hypothetical protein